MFGLLVFLLHSKLLNCNAKTQMGYLCALIKKNNSMVVATLNLRGVYTAFQDMND
jgi:hypothetical protein